MKQPPDPSYLSSPLPCPLSLNAFPLYPLYPVCGVRPFNEAPPYGHGVLKLWILVHTSQLAIITISHIIESNLCPFTYLFSGFLDFLCTYFILPYLFRSTVYRRIYGTFYKGLGVLKHSGVLKSSMDIVLAITITDSCRFQYYLKFFLLYWCTYLYSTYPLRPKLCYENYGDFRDDLALFTFVGEDLLLDDFISCLGLADLDWDFLKVSSVRYLGSLRVYRAILRKV